MLSLFWLSLPSFLSALITLQVAVPGVALSVSKSYPTVCFGPELPNGGVVAAEVQYKKQAELMHQCNKQVELRNVPVG